MIVSRAIALSLQGFLALLVPMQASAEMRASPFTEFREAKIRLLAERDAQGVLAGALEIRLTDGFKTYWKNAGDSGVPPVFDFSQSRGAHDVMVRFPLPQSFDDGAGGKAFGYKHDVMFVLGGTAEPGAILRLKLDFAVCGTLCIPLNAELVLDLDTAPGAETESAAHLVAVSAALPKTLGTQGVSMTRGGANEFVIQLPYVGDTGALQVFPEAPAFFEVKEVRPAGDGMVALKLLAQPAPGKATLGPLTLTYGTARESFERVLDVDRLPP